MANTYNPTLAQSVAQATGSRFQDVGKDFNEGFEPGMDKAVNYLEKQEAEAEAQRKKEAAANAKKAKEAEELALNDYKNAPNFEVDEKSGISSRMLGKVVNFGKQYKKEYSDTVTGFKNNMNTSFEERLGYEDQKKNIGTNFQQLIKDTREVSEALLEIDQSLKEGAMSTANGPEEAKIFKNLYETLEPTAQPGVFTWSNPETGKTEEITKSQIAEETDKFIFVGAKSYEAILGEADAIAAGTKTTVKGKQYYNFNEPQKRTLRAKLNAQLADPNTGDDFLFDTISNNKTPVGPLNMGERYNGKSKSVILAQAKLDMDNDLATDDEAKEFLRNQVAESYIDLFSKAFPTPPNEVEEPENTDVDTAFGLITEKVGEGPEGIIELTNQWKEDLSTDVVMDGGNLVIASNQGEIIQKVNLKDKNEVKNFLGQLIKKQYGNSSTAQKLKTKLSGVDLSGIGNEFKASTDEVLSAIEKIQRVKNKIK